MKGGGKIQKKRKKKLTTRIGARSRAEDVGLANDEHEACKRHNCRTVGYNGQPKSLSEYCHLIHVGSFWHLRISQGQRQSHEDFPLSLQTQSPHERHGSQQNNDIRQEVDDSGSDIPTSSLMTGALDVPMDGLGNRMTPIPGNHHHTDPPSGRE